MVLHYGVSLSLSESTLQKWKVRENQTGILGGCCEIETEVPNQMLMYAEADLDLQYGMTLTPIVVSDHQVQ